MRWLACFFLILSLAFLTPVPLSVAAPMPPAKAATGSCHEQAPAKPALPATDHTCCPSVAAIHPAVAPVLHALDTQRVALSTRTAQLRDGHPHDVFHPPRT